MRRWYMGSAIVGFLAVAVLFGSRMLSMSGQGHSAQAPQPASQLAKSRIDHVTVYPNSALVTREVEVPAGKGLIDLVVPAPVQIMPSTMYCDAGTGPRVLTTRYSTRQVLEDTIRRAPQTGSGKRRAARR